LLINIWSNLSEGR